MGSENPLINDLTWQTIHNPKNSLIPHAIKGLYLAARETQVYFFAIGGRNYFAGKAG
jgi:hypothetical protein